jgi:hypothetical protein
VPETILQQQAGAPAAGGLKQDMKQGQPQHLFPAMIGADLDAMMGDRGCDAVIVVKALQSFEEERSIRRKTSDFLVDVDPLIRAFVSEPVCM